MGAEDLEYADVEAEKEKIKNHAIADGYGQAKFDGVLSGTFIFIVLMIAVVATGSFLSIELNTLLLMSLFVSPLILIVAVVRGHYKFHASIEPCIDHALQQVQCPFCSTPHSWKFLEADDRLLSAVPRSRSSHSGYRYDGDGGRSSITQHKSWVDEVHEITSYHGCVTCGEIDAYVHTVRRKTGKQSSRTW